MNKPLLILDANFLCHRAWHSTGGLTYEGSGTGVLFGVYRDIIELQDRFDTDLVVFCFDSKHSNRKKLFPAYKAAREDYYNNATPDHKASIDEFRRQVNALRSEYLRKTGFNNVFQAKGYESDDLIAKICLGLKPDEEAVIITSDHDLFQCLTSQIAIYNPQHRKLITLATWREAWPGLEPAQWASIKAWAGCKTDNIPGVKGIGDKTAAAYISKRLQHTQPRRLAKFKVKTNQILMQRNLQLVKLPFPGTPKPTIVADTVTIEKWEQVAASLGFTGLRSLAPLGARAQRARGVRQGFIT